MPPGCACWWAMVAAAGPAVEGAGRLVGEEHRGPGDQRPGDRDPLLLTAGQLGRTPAAEPVESDPGEHLLDVAPARPPPAEPQRQRDVVVHGQRGQQVVRLEDESHRCPAQLRQRDLAERAEIGPVELDGARGRPVQTGRALQQRRLAGAGRTHHRGEGAGTEQVADTAQRIGAAGLGDIGLGDAVEQQGWCRHGPIEAGNAAGIAGAGSPPRVAPALPRRSLQAP